MSDVRKENGSPRKNFSRLSSNVNAISPCEEEDEKGIQTKNEETIKNKNYLFLSNLSKSKKSFSYNVTSERVIYVEHYAQSEQDLFEGVPEEVPHNYETAIVLFFVHGVGGSAKLWEPQIQYFLFEGYEIVTFDLIGHGHSSKPSNGKAYYFSELARDVVAVFDKFHKKKNVLIGHSYGSSFCTYLAKHRSHLVNKIILISGGGPTTLMPDRCSAFCLPFPLFYVISPAVVKLFRRLAFDVHTSSRVRNKVTTFGLSPFALRAIMQGQYWDESDEEFHADLMLPVLLIYGRGDQLVSMDEEVWMNETIYASQLDIIDNAGHMVTIEAPTAVNASIHNFLNRDETTASHSRQNNDVQEISDEREAVTLEPNKLSPKKWIDDSERSASPASIRSLSRQSQSVRVGSRLSQFPRPSSRLSQKSLKLSRSKTMF